jgi:signal transduction histidine kinase/integral membrane sensor domain MASE1
VVFTAVLVCVAYFVGSRVGDALRFMPLITSVMWPPNAILTATLLLAPPRRWWIYILAVFPAHYFGQPADRGLLLVLLLFLTNWSEALIAAISVRAFSGSPTRFDTLRRMAGFIAGAVVLAPFLSSFADAAVVSLFRGEPYGMVWRVRFFSNVLTELALVPAILLAITRGPAWFRSALPRRRLEAVAVMVAPVFVWSVIFESMDGWHAFRASPALPLAFLLPSLLWSAVRFGTGGTSLSLLVTIILATSATAQGRGPLTTVPGEGILGLQIFLTLVGIPLMCLAAVIEERGQAQEAVREQLRFEQLLARLSSSFVHLPGEALQEASETWAGRLGESLRLDEVALHRLSRNPLDFVVVSAWTAPGLPPRPPCTSRDVPWIAEQLRNERVVAIERPEEMPAKAARDVETFRRKEIRSCLSLPLVSGGRLVGALTFITIRSERAWSQELVQRLELVGEVFANAFAQKEAQDALRASEVMKSAILGSLSSGVAVLDRDGRIVAVNDSWARLTPEWEAFGVQVEADDNHVSAAWTAGVDGVAAAREATVGIAAVLNGSRDSFAFEYAAGPPAAARWLALSAVPLKGPEGGAVVSHTDVTERKRAEMEAQRSRQELAHFTRVSTMGELTASLAHELNQPLTAILANAKAAQRFLDHTSPDLGEIREILSDIVDDDRRAGEVIQRLREFLRKGDADFSPLDMNGLLRDVVKLVASDAVIRNVTLALDLGPEATAVNGDRVQLQQLILNLLLNAMEAVAEASPEKRVVTIRSRIEERVVHLEVQDTGPGLQEGVADVIFEPFYTTKAAGMGMGLSIARSIVEAHGGKIRAANNAAGGASFHVVIPLVSATRT